MTEGAPNSTFLLTEEQCRNDESRILHDAELIRNGARFNEIGTLVLTEVQVAALALAGNVEPDIEMDPELLAWLDQDCDSFLSQDGPYAYNANLLKRAENIMHRDGIRTVRDLYVIGRSGFADLRNAGDKVVDLVGTLFTRVAWPDKPEPEVAAEVCETLNQVSALVLLRARLLYKSGFKAGLSVADILQTPSEENAETFFPNLYDFSSKQRAAIAAEIVAAANDFMIKFLAARERVRKH